MYANNSEHLIKEFKPDKCDLRMTSIHFRKFSPCICYFPLALPVRLHYMIVCSYVSDDNECESELNLCTNGRCNNLEGSFECKCDPGYELSPTGDECNGKMNETVVLKTDYTRV